MFPETLLPNLVVLLGGLSASWCYLRTGRFWIGAGTMGLLLALADWALVARAVYAIEGATFRVPLHGMQGVAVATAAALLWGRWRRRWSAAAQQRPARFAAALQGYLRGELEVAERAFRDLVRTDPWDAAAWAALGNVARARGRLRRARACWRRARAVDRHGEYADFLALQEARVAVPEPRATSAVSTAAPAASELPRHPAPS